MDDIQAKRIVNVLRDVVGGDETPKGLEALTMAISSNPLNQDQDVVSALKEIAAGLHDVADAIRETGNPTLS